MPVTTHEPFIAKERSIGGFMVHVLLPAFLRRHSVSDTNTRSSRIGRYSFGPNPLLTQGRNEVVDSLVTLDVESVVKTGRAERFHATSSVAEQVLRTRHYRTVGLSYT